MVGKVLVPAPEEHRDSSSPTDKRRDGKNKMSGVSRVAFGNEGEAWLLGGERLWRIAFAGVGGGGMFESL